ncbi:MAG: BrnT family toxin [Pseudomonadota bacterium]
MNLEWDERKRRSNLEKHGLDFLDVSAVFEAPHVAVPSVNYGGKEERFLAIGLFEGRNVTVVYTTRSEAIRVISFRRARYEERQKYQELYGNWA